MDIVIEQARTQDTDAVLALLRQSALPVDGLHDHIGTTFVARQHGAIVGVAALEVYPGAVLLRSVAVSAAMRGQGLGQRLTAAALASAREHAAVEAYLLTTTAAGFFPRFGFAAVDRADVPEAVKASIEFTSACPASAVVMRAAI